MPDKSCKEACAEAYKDSVKNCNKILIQCLAEAEDDNEKKKKCKERFNRCMKLCKEAREICNEGCD